MKIFSICSYCLKNQKRFLSAGRPLLNGGLTRSRINRASQSPDTSSFKLCTAYCTGESYNLENIKTYFNSIYQKYSIGVLPSDASDVLHVSKLESGGENGDIFLFRRLGAFVCWNISEQEITFLRDVLKQHEVSSYDSTVIEEAYEQLNFMHTDQRTSLLDGDMYLSRDSSEEVQALEKLTFSNAMALSVKLDMWESSLENFSASLRYVPEVLKRGYKVSMTRHEVLQKIGELLTLRHQINLYSDVLAVPDFYWDRENLEMLYLRTCTYLEISKRTKIMNEKLNLCTELVEMLRSHLNDEHSHRLEWMIIVLITIEILFEVIHLVEKYI